MSQSIRLQFVENYATFPALKDTCSRDYFRLKLSPTSGRCPQWLQSNCKEAMNIVWGQFRGAIFNFFIVKECPFCIFRMLPSVPKITSVFIHSSIFISNQIIPYQPCLITVINKYFLLLLWCFKCVVDHTSF